MKFYLPGHILCMATYLGFDSANSKGYKLCKIHVEAAALAP